MTVTTFLLTALMGMIGGGTTQWFRLWLDGRAARARGRSTTFRAMRQLARHYPEGPPGLDPGASPKAVQPYIDELERLAGHIRDGWPSDLLPLTFEHLLDALTRLAPETDPGARAAVLRLYEVCSQHLTILDRGILEIRAHRSRALPLIGFITRSNLEWRACKDVARLLPSGRYGLPSVASAVLDAGAGV